MNARPYVDPEAAARKLVEMANGVEVLQDGRIQIDKINGPFLFQLNGTRTNTRQGLIGPLRTVGFACTRARLS